MPDAREPLTWGDTPGTWAQVGERYRLWDDVGADERVVDVIEQRHEDIATLERSVGAIDDLEGGD